MLEDRQRRFGVAFLGCFVQAHGHLQLAVSFAFERGHVSDGDVQAVKHAGYDDAQVIEIVQHVALNTWTNYINEVAKTEIDFPAAAARDAA